MVRNLTAVTLGLLLLGSSALASTKTATNTGSHAVTKTTTNNTSKRSKRRHHMSSHSKKKTDAASKGSR